MMPTSSIVLDTLKVDLLGSHDLDDMEELPGVSADLMPHVLEELGCRSELLVFEDDTGGFASSGRHQPSSAVPSDANIRPEHFIRVLGKNPSGMKLAHTDIDMPLPVGCLAISTHEVTSGNFSVVRILRRSP